MKVAKVCAGFSQVVISIIRIGVGCTCVSLVVLRVSADTTACLRMFTGIGYCICLGIDYFFCVWVVSVKYVIDSVRSVIVWHSTRPDILF